MRSWLCAEKMLVPAELAAQAAPTTWALEGAGTREGSSAVICVGTA